MIFGYARVSTKDQNLDLQVTALKNAGCEKIFEEKKSSVSKRKEFETLMDQLRANDILVVWKLDRLGRTTLELIKLINLLNEKNVKFKSLNDSLIDTTTPNGKLVFSIFSALAEHEREIIRERTKAGLESARARGRHGGRPKGLSKEAKMKAAAASALYLKKESNQSIMKALDIKSKATLYRYLRYENISINEKK
jgi:DNA invertase Pin-like site-specific DNA recombinase